MAEWGDRTKPPLVLLHGFSQSSSTWEQVAQRLANDRFVVAPDFIGHGKSDKSRELESYEMGAVLNMITGLLRWLWADQIDLCGYSMGGRVALAFACTQPQRVSSLILESTGLGPKTEQQHQAMLRRDSEMIAKLSDGSIEEFMNEWEQQPVFESQHKLSAETKKALRRARCNNDPLALALTIRGMGQHTMPDLSRRIEKLPMPILYIAGILDRRYVKIAEALQYVEGISSVLLNTGHNTHLEAPDSFTKQVNAFLRDSSSLGMDFF